MMQDIFALDELRRYPAGSQGPRSRSETFELAQTLTQRQKSLLAAILLEDDIDLIRECLISPTCFSENMQQANWVISRFEDGRLYSKHIQGPSHPTEKIPSELKEWFNEESYGL